MKRGSKYEALYNFLRESGAVEITLSLDRVDELIPGRLPPSARRQRSWWSNRSQGVGQASAWMGAGYEVSAVDLERGQVTFKKTELVYHVKRDQGIVMWNGELVKALRRHMGLTQAEFAQELGVRQPTVSEWETGVYEPKRSTSKLLTLVAEKAGFEYE